MLHQRRAFLGLLSVKCGKADVFAAPQHDQHDRRQHDGSADHHDEREFLPLKRLGDLRRVGLGNDGPGYAAHAARRRQDLDTSIVGADAHAIALHEGLGGRQLAAGQGNAELERLRHGLEEWRRGDEHHVVALATDHHCLGGRAGCGPRLDLREQSLERIDRHGEDGTRRAAPQSCRDRHEEDHARPWRRSAEVNIDDGLALVRIGCESHRRTRNLWVRRASFAGMNQHPAIRGDELDRDPFGIACQRFSEQQLGRLLSAAVRGHAFEG